MLSSVGTADFYVGQSRASCRNQKSRTLAIFCFMHIGEQIQKELRRQERTVTWLARKLCCNRQNVYDIFRRATIDTELLLRISLALEFNFFTLYYKEYKDRKK